MWTRIGRGELATAADGASLQSCLSLPLQHRLFFPACSYNAAALMGLQLELVLYQLHADQFKNQLVRR